jgi:dinuclear metal center YbgI/SA1388 family protein
MKIREVASFLEELAPRSSQENYDNSGLLIGDPQVLVSGVLICLDCTETVVSEAVKLGCNLIIAHHPLIFGGLKSLTGANYCERTVLSCIKNDIALYAIHTNLDNYWKGVNYEIGTRLGLKNLRILEPKTNVLCSVIVYVPKDALEQVNNAVFEAGGGKIANYESCHFHSNGTGTFKPVDDANPTIGQVNKLSVVEEVRAEYLVSKHKIAAVLSAMKNVHPYEEVAHHVVPLSNENQTEGSGMIGELEQEMNEIEFLNQLKATFNCGVIRHTGLLGKPIKKIAFCGGSGSFLLKKAIREQADIFVTGDFKYHEFFDADNQLVIADIGHYESEQFTSNLIAAILKKKFTTFAVHLTGINTNPINYF